MKTRPCRDPKCKAKIIDVEEVEAERHDITDPPYKKTGKRIPVDVSSPVYRIVSYSVDEVLVVRDKFALVSHFRTCTNPSKFSKRGRRGS